MRKVAVEQDLYFDSIFLMRVSSDLKQLPGVTEGVVSLGTEVHKARLVDLGFPAAALLAADGNDVIIAIEAQSQSDCDTALAVAKHHLRQVERPGDRAAIQPRTLRSALAIQPGANLALISVPGIYAAREAAEALDLGLHVMLFSDHVTLADEVTLKRRAVAQGLLMMGPDCGTAMINGKPLGFANRVRRGNIGIVGASGTGMQEVSCLIHAMGGGISQAIGTGGRDLQTPEVGGMMALQGIAALAAEAQTAVIVMIAKPPHPDVAEVLIDRLTHCGKPAVVHFLGTAPRADQGKVQFATSLYHTAELALACTGHAVAAPQIGPDDLRSLARQEASRMAPQQQFLRGLYTGGSLADEALFRLDNQIGPVYSNLHSHPDRRLNDPLQSHGHTVVDLGDDVFTSGKPHPMIDPSLRAERIRQEGQDATVGLLLLDLVLGHGAHHDPAGATIPAIAESRARALSRGGYLPVVMSITGTDADPQNRRAQAAKLEQIGCLVMASNVQAVHLALAIAEAAWGGV